ncbi:MAG: glycosyltransferase family 2 protein, partial [Bdellovibrionota bacterium]
MLPMDPSYVLVIPAYEPSQELIPLVRGLVATVGLGILVVNDGSSPDKTALFSELSAMPEVTVIHHAVNLGKGAALKTAFNHALVHCPGLRGLITVDADGQHLPGDVKRLAEAIRSEPGSLHLGAREFKGKIPFRSRFGNELTRFVFKGLTGKKLKDTQTGLRAIPTQFVKTLLRVSTTGYDFETDMLILAIQSGVKIRETLIETVYLGNNESSHFDPLLDSARIYFVLIRFAFSSIATAGLDFLIFALCFSWSSRIAPSA